MVLHRVHVEVGVGDQSGARGLEARVRRGHEDAAYRHLVRVRVRVRVKGEGEGEGEGEGAGAGEGEGEGEGAGAGAGEGEGQWPGSG